MTNQDTIQNNNESAPRELDEAMRQEYFEAKKILDGRVSLVVAAQFWSDNKMLRIAQATTVEKAVNAVLADLQRRCASESFFRAAQVYYKRFVNKFGTRSVASIQGREITDWINAQVLSPRSKFEVRNKMSYLFRRAKMLELIDATPVLDKDLLPPVEPKPVTVLSTEKMRKFLKDIAKNHPKYFANFILRAFAGFRASEADRLRWEMIDEANKRIVVPASATKSGVEWILETPMLPDTVFHWLAAIPASEKHGKIPSPPMSFMKKFDREEFLLWKTNIMRHTFCAMQISRESSADRTAILLRHHGSPTTLYKRYANELVSAAKAKEYFGLRP